MKYLSFFCLLALIQEWLIPIDQMMDLQLFPVYTIALLVLGVMEMFLKGELHRSLRQGASRVG